MNEVQAMLEDLSCFFVIKRSHPDGTIELSLSGNAAFGDDRVTLPFDSETDAALFLLDEFRKGAQVSEQDVEIARAIIRGDQALFVYEEKQADGTLLLSLHDQPAPVGSSIIVFGSRSPRWLARFLVRRLHESKRVRASEETMQRAQLLLG